MGNTDLDFPRFLCPAPKKDLQRRRKTCMEGTHSFCKTKKIKILPWGCDDTPLP